jgi:hypothetical protein
MAEPIPATTHSDSQRYSLPVLWHLLSLDAPTVGALWFVVAARAAKLSLSGTDVAALALGTWMLYVLDRMLDARRSAMPLQEVRHRFHGVHQRFFLGSIACAVPVLLLLLAHMETRLLHAYLLLGLVLAGYFALIHTRRLAHAVPKEFAVGVIFAIAIFMPEFLRGVLQPLPQAICFGALCWLNCTVIYQREHHDLHDAHWSTRLAIRTAPLLLGAVAAAGLVLLFSGKASHALSLSVVVSAIVLTALGSARHRMSRLSFRIAADAALLTPLLFLFQ